MKIKYKCDKCGKDWDTEEQANKCENSPTQDRYLMKFNVGDFIIFNNRLWVVIDRTSQRHEWYPVIKEFGTRKKPYKITEYQNFTIVNQETIEKISKRAKQQRLAI